MAYAIYRSYITIKHTYSSNTKIFNVTWYIYISNVSRITIYFYVTSYTLFK